MIKTRDIIEIEIDNSWFKSGLEYALISWTSTFNRMGKPNPYSRLQKIILGIVAEKAMEQYLITNKIRYDIKGKTKWYEEDRYDIGINGFAIDVKANFLNLDSTYIQSKLKNFDQSKLDWFTRCHALVPMDQFNPGQKERRTHKRDKVYLFPFIEGFFNEGQGNDCLVHAFWDYKWLKRAESKDLPNLGKLKITYQGDLQKAKLKIYGTTCKNEICIETIDIKSKEFKTTNNFFQVLSLEWIGDIPNGILTIKSPILGITETIKPLLTFSLQAMENGYWPVENNWQNIGLHKCKVFLLGWIYEEDFRIIGKEYKRFTKTIEQYQETKVDNWGCVIENLEPIKTLKDI